MLEVLVASKFGYEKGDGDPSRFLNGLLLPLLPPPGPHLCPWSSRKPEHLRTALPPQSM